MHGREIQQGNYARNLPLEQKALAENFKELSVCVYFSFTVFSTHHLLSSSGGRILNWRYICPASVQEVLILWSWPVLALKSCEWRIYPP